MADEMTDAMVSAFEEGLTGGEVVAEEPEENTEESTDELAEETTGGAEETQAEGEQEQAEETPVPALEMEGLNLTDTEQAKAEMRVAQLQSQGIDEGFANYIANLEQEVQQHRHSPKTELQAALEETAAILGVSPEEFAKTAPQWAIDARTDTKVRELMESGLEEDVARRIAAAEVKADMAEKVSAQKKAQDAVMAEFDRDLQKLYTAYPKLDRTKPLPAEVIADFKRGLTPLEAYQKYELTQALKAKETAKKAASKTAGSVKSEKPPENDDMMSLLISGFEEG